MRARQLVRLIRWTAGVGAVALLPAASLAQTPSPPPSGSNVVLSGGQEVPPASSSASVSGSVTTTGIAGTAAHIHLAAPGRNGPVIVPLNKTGDNVWSVPPGIRLNDAQYEAFKLGNLYVHVHSANNPAGEIRGQITP